MNSDFSTSIRRLIGGTLPFAVYFLPGTSEVTFMAGEAKEFHALLKGEVPEKGFIFAPYKASQKYPIWSIVPDHYALGEENIISLIKRDITVSLDKGQQACLGGQNATESQFLVMVDAAIEEIKGSDSLQKVVMSRSQSVDLSSDFDPINMFIKMREGMPSAFCYMTYIPGQGLWMGATPERLLEVEGDRAQTNALAGTLRNGTDETWSTKEIDEQQIVTDYIAQRLDEVGFENYTIEGPSEMASGSVRHLRSVFSFDIKNNQEALSVINALHPTPAICGMPKEEADNFIAQNEHYSREYYSGYLGPIGIYGATHVFVNLRCMKIVGQRASLFVGAGITAGSEAQKEWQETRVKALTLLNVIRN